MPRMRLPCPAKIVAFEPADGVGTLEVDAGEKLPFGASACVGFTPEIGMSCWLIATKPNAIGGGVRAKTVNLSGIAGPDRLTQIQEATRRADEEERRDEQRRREIGVPVRAYEVVEERTGFKVPPLYRRMESDGLLRYREPSGERDEAVAGRAVTISPALVCVNDFEWLALEDMATWEPPDYWRPEHVFIPFAQTGRRDLWCWYLPWTAEGKTPVVLARSDRNEAEARASDFESMLLREMLEQFACSYDDDLHATEPGLRERVADRLREDLRANAETLRPYIRGEWMALLLGLLDRPFREVQDRDALYLALLGEDELGETLRREMDFPHAREVFPHMQP